MWVPVTDGVCRYELGLYPSKAAASGAALEVFGPRSPSMPWPVLARRVWIALEKR
jgi:hypothetical protein